MKVIKIVTMSLLSGPCLGTSQNRIVDRENGIHGVLCKI
jgi:hypothetical protein